MCVFQSEVLGVLEEETWASFQQRQFNFNQVAANILWISPLNKFSSSQDELSLKAFCKSGRFQHSPLKSNCWDSRIPGLQVVHRNPGFQLPPMEWRSGTTCGSALCCPFAFGSTRGEESRKVGCWWLLSLDTNHLGFFSFKLNAWEPENDSFQVRNLLFFRVSFRWNHGNNFRGATLDGSEIRQTQPVEGQVVYPIIYRVLYMPGGAGFLPSTVSVYFNTSGIFSRISTN